MKNRKLVRYLAMALIGSVLAVFSVFSQEDITTVKDSAFGIRERGEVAFVHDAHNEKAGVDDCAECHHVYDDAGKKQEGETSEDKECSECHMAGGKNRLDLVRAYHLNCKGCHEAQKAGPVMCGECHQ